MASGGVKVSGSVGLLSAERRAAWLRRIAWKTFSPQHARELEVMFKRIVMEVVYSVYSPEVYDRTGKLASSITSILRTDENGNPYMEVGIPLNFDTASKTGAGTYARFMLPVEESLEDNYLNTFWRHLGKPDPAYFKLPRDFKGAWRQAAFVAIRRWFEEAKAQEELR